MPDSQKLIHQMSSPDLRALHNHPSTKRQILFSYFPFQVPRKPQPQPEIRRSNFEAEKIQHYVQGTSAFDLLNDFKEVRKEQLQIQRPTRLGTKRRFFAANCQHRLESDENLSINLEMSKKLCKSCCLSIQIF